MTARKKTNSKKKAATKKKAPVKKVAGRKKPASKPDPKPKAQLRQADPEPGIYHDVSREDYESWRYANNSLLGHFEKTAAHALIAKEHPKAPTPALILGTHIHLATLAGSLEEYAISAPMNTKTGKQHDRRTKVGQVAWAEAEATARSREILSVQQYETCKMMRAAFRADPTANDILSGEGVNEASIVWDDPATGVRCKGRVDRITEHEGWSCVVDLKSTLDASPDGWPYQVERYRLARQAAFYLDGVCGAVDERPRRFIFLALEKMTGPPYTVGGPMCYIPQDSVIEQGRMEYRALLKRYKQAVEDGEWPGYPRGLQYFYLPERAYRYIEGGE